MYIKTDSTKVRRAARCQAGQQQIEFVERIRCPFENPIGTLGGLGTLPVSQRRK